MVKRLAIMNLRMPSPYFFGAECGSGRCLPQATFGAKGAVLAAFKGVKAALTPTGLHSDCCAVRVEQADVPGRTFLEYHLPRPGTPCASAPSPRRAWRTHHCRREYDPPLLRGEHLRRWRQGVVRRDPTLRLENHAGDEQRQTL